MDVRRNEALAAFSAEDLILELLFRARQADGAGSTDGAGVRCPVCSWSGAKFADYDCGFGNIYRNAECPSCLTHPRHRAFILVLRELLPTDRPLRLLHFAPEKSLVDFFEARDNVEYLSVDIEADRAMKQEDITRLSFADNSFDVIFCSHVLEHVEDDKAAMAELRRVLHPDGFAILDVPIDYDRAETYEDPTVVAPEDRAREFWQFDHVRLYGRDFPTKLRTAGFAVREERMIPDLDEPTRERFGLEPLPMYVCRKD